MDIYTLQVAVSQACSHVVDIMPISTTTSIYLPNIKLVFEFELELVLELKVELELYFEPEFELEL